MKRMTLVLVAAVTMATIGFWGVASAQEVTTSDPHDLGDTTTPQNAAQEENAAKDSSATNGTVDAQKHRKHRGTGSGTRTITRNFFANQFIDCKNTPTSPTILPCNPYPSQKVVNIKKLKGGALDVNVFLNAFSWPGVDTVVAPPNNGFPDDADVLLAHNGRCAIILSDVGGAIPATVNLKLDDQATSFLPDDGPLTSGTFKPTNIGLGDTFPTPAPNPATCSSSLSVFNGLNPNGAWSLFVVDDVGFDASGSISNWGLQIKARVKK